MRNAVRYILFVFAGIIIGMGALFAVFRAASPTTVDSALGKSAYTTVSTQNATERELMNLAFEVASYIKTEDYKALGKMVHTSYGVVFSPSGTINLQSNKCLSAAEIADLGDGSAVFAWGPVVNSDAPVEMKATDFFKEYVYDRDYINAPLIGVNYITKSGNSLENVTDIFPNGQYVDLCFPGTGENEYHDWSVLRLVFEDCDGEYKLTGIIHSEYTI